MGGAASLPEALSLDVIQQIAGDKFDQDKYDSAPKDSDGNVSKADFLALFAGGGESKEGEEKESGGGAARRGTFSGGTYLETYGSVLSRAIWRWKEEQVEGFFASGMVDENDEPIIISGPPPVGATGREFILGGGGLSPEDAAVVQEQLMHVAALFVGEIAMLESDEERAKISKALNLVQNHVPYSWDAATTVAKLDAYKVSHPSAVGNGMSLYTNSWDMDDDNLDRLHHMLEKEAWLFMVDMATKEPGEEKEAEEKE